MPAAAPSGDAEGDHIVALEHRLAKDIAAFLDQHLGDLHTALFDEVGGTAEDGLALGGQRLAPGFLRSGDVGGGGLPHQGDGLAGVGIDHRGDRLIGGLPGAEPT